MRQTENLSLSLDQAYGLNRAGKIYQSVHDIGRMAIENLPFSGIVFNRAQIGESRNAIGIAGNAFAKHRIQRKCPCKLIPMGKQQSDGFCQRLAINIRPIERLLDLLAIGDGRILPVFMQILKRIILYNPSDILCHFITDTPQPNGSTNHPTLATPLRIE